MVATYRAQRLDQFRGNPADAGCLDGNRLELAQISKDRRGTFGELGVLGRRQRCDSQTAAVYGGGDSLRDQGRRAVGRPESGGRVGVCCGLGGLAPTDSRDGSSGPLQHFFEFCPGPFPGPTTAFLERDERARVDDPVGRQAALADVKFTTARSRGRPCANHAGVRCDRRSVVRRVVRQVR
ncbi:Uncharacterised protein [Mycobacterium tuberculosis]|nr:Uncharacterised protein [Mycobacterium tuberculosis]